MVDALKPGKMHDTAASMADAMWQAFVVAREDYGGSILPDEQMKLLFVAIAQGVVKHLTEHPGAFKLSTDVTGISADGLYQQ